MYWPLHTPKEISFLPWQLRDRVRDAAERRYLDDRRTIWRRVAQVAFCAAGWWLVASIPKRFGCPEVVHACLALGAPFVLLALCAATERRPFLRACAVELLARGIRPAGCLACGYNLTGSVSDHCPECGDPLAPRAEANSAHGPPPTDQRPVTT